LKNSPRSRNALDPAFQPRAAAGGQLDSAADRPRRTRFAEASREMLQRGDYVVPWFNGAWRFDKPILIYWCQSASYRVFGENDFAARLPSVLFTTATALLLVRWGRKIADATPKPGFSRRRDVCGRPARRHHRARGHGGHGDGFLRPRSRCGAAGN
jgi:hypothetical protein